MSNHADYTGVDNLEVMAEAHNYNGWLVNLVLEHTTAAGRLRDFGAGAGTFALPVAQAGREVLCLEPDSTLQQHLEGQGLDCIADLGQLAEASVDSIYSLNVLEHIEDDAGALHSLRRVLRPGGTLLIYVPAFNLLYSSMDEKVGHYRRYRRRALMRLVSASGFRVDRAAYVDSLGFFAALLYRATDRGGGNINRRALAIYDRWLFPLSRLIDRITGRLFGKNVMLVARRADAG